MWRKEAMAETMRCCRSTRFSTLLRSLSIWFTFLCFAAAAAAATTATIKTRCIGVNSSQACASLPPSLPPMVVAQVASSAFTSRPSRDMYANHPVESSAVSFAGIIGDMPVLFSNANDVVNVGPRRMVSSCGASIDAERRCLLLTLLMLIPMSSRCSRSSQERTLSASRYWKLHRCGSCPSKGKVTRPSFSCPEPVFLSGSCRLFTIKCIIFVQGKLSTRSSLLHFQSLRFF